MHVISDKIKLERCWFLRQSAKTMSTLPALSEGELRSAVFALIILESSHLDDIINPKQYRDKQVN